MFFCNWIILFWSLRLCFSTNSGSLESESSVITQVNSVSLNGSNGSFSPRDEDFLEHLSSYGDRVFNFEFTTYQKIAEFSSLICTIKNIMKESGELSTSEQSALRDEYFNGNDQQNLEKALIFVRLATGINFVIQEGNRMADVEFYTEPIVELCASVFTEYYDTQSYKDAICNSRFKNISYLLSNRHFLGHMFSFFVDRVQALSSTEEWTMNDYMKLCDDLFALIGMDNEFLRITKVLHQMVFAMLEVMEIDNLDWINEVRDALLNNFDISLSEIREILLATLKDDYLRGEMKGIVHEEDIELATSTKSISKSKRSSRKRYRDPAENHGNPKNKKRRELNGNKN